MLNEKRKRPRRGLVHLYSKRRETGQKNVNCRGRKGAAGVARPVMGGPAAGVEKGGSTGEKPIFGETTLRQLKFGRKEPGGKKSLI